MKECKRKVLIKYRKISCLDKAVLDSFSGTDKVVPDSFSGTVTYEEKKEEKEVVMEEAI